MFVAIRNRTCHQTTAERSVLCQAVKDEGMPTFKNPPLGILGILKKPQLRTTSQCKCQDTTPLPQMLHIAGVNRFRDPLVFLYLLIYCAGGRLEFIKFYHSILIWRERLESCGTALAKCMLLSPEVCAWEPVPGPDHRVWMPNSKAR